MTAWQLLLMVGLMLAFRAHTEQKGHPLVSFKTAFGSLNFLERQTLQDWRKWHMLVTTSRFLLLD